MQNGNRFRRDKTNDLIEAYRFQQSTTTSNIHQQSCVERLLRTLYFLRIKPQIFPNNERLQKVRLW
jgi:hypothetical protein